MTPRTAHVQRMTLTIDARIPVRIVPVPPAPLAPDEALFAVPPAAEGRLDGHAAACACCPTRDPVAQALALLFQARARGETGFFRRVVALAPEPARAASLARALAEDPLVRFVFRLDPTS